LQDYSQPMLDQARQRLAQHADRLRYVVCDLLDPSWPQQVGETFNLAVSAIVLHNLPRTDNIFACYRAIRDLLGPESWFLNYDRFLDGVDRHVSELRDAGFTQVECRWQQPPHAIVVAGPTTA
jgi:hypothetical protein